MNSLKIFDLTGKNAVVTGGAKGLGKSISSSLAMAGANVIILDIDINSASTTVENLSAKGKHLALKVDVTKEADVVDAINRLVEIYKSIDILINNAGVCQRVDTTEMSLKEWNKTFDVNVNSLFLLSKYTAPIMKSNGGGSIINIASMAGIVSMLYSQSAYNASKGAVIMLTKSLANEWVDDSIRVNAVAPGFLETNMTKPMFENEGPLSYVLDHVPMKRLGKTHELEGVIIFLASEASSFVTGSVISVDGGYTSL